MLVHNLAQTVAVLSSASPTLASAFVSAVTSATMTIGVLTLLGRLRRRFHCTRCQLIGSLMRKASATLVGLVRPSTRGRHRMWDKFEHQSSIRSDHPRLSRLS